MSGRGSLGLVLAVLVAAGASGVVGAFAGDDPLVGEPVFSFTDQRIDESSGLVARRGLVVTVNDSGDSNRIFTLDPATGDTVGVTRWQGDARDIEALAPTGDGNVWVGDIGDNDAVRKSVTIAKVPFGRGDRTVDAPTYELAYPDGAHDAETLLADPATGQVLVVTKEAFGRIYAAPEVLDPDGPNELRPLGRVLGIATDGSFFPDGRHLVVRNYGQAAIYSWPELERVTTLQLPPQPQGEAITVSSAGAILIGSEGVDVPVLRVELPTDLTALLAEPGAAPADDPDASPEAAPAQAEDDRDWWPWALGGVAGVLIIAMLLRSLRPR